jgi:predicted DNA binding CopG/RHH family protein
MVMPAKIGELPCYKAVTTRLDERDFEALSLAVSKTNMNQTQYIRRLIRQHLNINNTETPAA